MVTNKIETYMQSLLETACNQHASDIHFYPTQNKSSVHIYFRILGKRIFYEQIDIKQYTSFLTYLKFSSNMDIGEVRKPQNGVIPFISKKKFTYSLRISTLPIVHSESMTIRILPQENVPALDELFLFPYQANRIKSWTKNRTGLILITGPTGSGKSTLLYALLEHILRETSLQAITLEDPVERHLQHVLQVEINNRAGITYEQGLKAALRHDPDVLLVGEIRDDKTAEFCFSASLTGHLVMSTLHANNAVQTIERLIDLGINRIDIEQTLISIAAMELLPIKSRGVVSRRAAITEILDGHRLTSVVANKNEIQIERMHTFHHLRKKALLYDFITKKTYKEQNV